MGKFAENLNLGKRVLPPPGYPEGFPEHIFRRGVVATPLRIINTKGHITLY